MLLRILDMLRGIANYTSILIIIGIALFTLLFDGPRYAKIGYVKEVKIIKAISYTYIVIGGLIYILLLIS